MFCKNCGNRIDNDDIFCDACGAALHSANAHEKHPADIKVKAEIKSQPCKKISGAKKAAMVICCTIVVLIGIAVAGIVLVRNSDAYNVAAQLERGNYEKAIQLYEHYVADSKLHSFILEQLISQDYNNMVNKYLAGKVEYSTALDYISAIISIGIVDDAQARLSDMIISRSDYLVAQYESNYMDYDDASLELNALFAHENKHLSSSYAMDKLEYLINLNYSKIAYELAEQYLEDENYEDAIEQYSLVDEHSTYYADALNKLSMVSDEYRSSILINVNNYIDLNDYPRAIATLEYALSVLSDDAELQQSLTAIRNEYHAEIKNTALSQSTDYIADNNYLMAISVLRSALDILSSDSQLLAAYDSCITTYVSSVKDSVNSILETDWNSAQKLIEEALKNLPDNADLLELLETVMNAKPVDLLELTVVDSYHYEMVERCYDTYGNLYYRAATILDDPGYLIYNLNGEYTSLSCTIAPLQGFESDVEISIVISADNKLIYESPIIVTSAPLDLELDVSGCTLLKFELVLKSGNKHRDSMILIADTVLKKAPLID